MESIKEERKTNRYKSAMNQEAQNSPAKNMDIQDKKSIPSNEKEISDFHVASEKNMSKLFPGKGDEQKQVAADLHTQQQKDESGEKEQSNYDPSSGQPPTLEQIITAGKVSPKFQTLLSEAGITDKNNSKISYVDPAPNIVTGTDIFTGNITLVKEVNLYVNVTNLTHELTNSKNSATFRQIYYNMETGVTKDSKDFADQLLSVEAEAALNQVIVASELKIRFSDEEAGMNQFLDAYNKGVPKEKILEVMRQMQGEMINPQTNKNLRTQYIEDGKRIRADYLKNHPDSNTPKQDSKKKKK